MTDLDIMSDPQLQEKLDRNYVIPAFRAVFANVPGIDEWIAGELIEKYGK